MNNKTKKRIRHLLEVRLQLLVVISWMLVLMNGQIVESGWGWISYPPQMVSLAASGQRRRLRKARSRKGGGWRKRWRLGQRWKVAAMRSLVIGSMWLVSGGQVSGWLVGLPWLVWIWNISGRMWPVLKSQPEWQVIGWLIWQGQRISIVGAVLVVSAEWLSEERLEEGSVLSLGCVVCGRREAWVQVERQADESYRVEMCGHFSLAVKDDEPFRKRMLILFLRLLEVPGPQRSIGRTREDRAPFVRQMQISGWFEVPQPNVSRWERYWQLGNWPDLLSLKTVEIMSQEVRAEIMAVCAAYPWWGVRPVHQHLRQQGSAISYPQVRQAVQESGWGQLRQSLQQRYQLSADSFRPRDGWLVSQLLELTEKLLERLETGERLPQQEQLRLKEVQNLATECGCAPATPLKGLPWLYRLEQLLFGQWSLLDDEQVHCLYCGSNQVARKSKQPRYKNYYDQHRELQTVAVYRYYCRNQACDKGSFTNLPAGLSPYSPYRLQTKLLALQLYGWGYSTYRRTGQALGVSTTTAYDWVSAWGSELLPMAALFGLVKSSGVVGVDEKYVLVPKNDKPAGKRRRWMYVYLAVDAYTYDLLHIAIYPHKDKNSAQAFLLALRAKGYQPRVIVTDLRQDYGNDIARVFPKAIHHECIFHALQDVSITCRRIYGSDYRHTQPEVLQLRQQITHIFQAKTKRTAHKRYLKIMARRDYFVQHNPQANTIFDFLERHWPTLVNAIESRLIPKTNNAVEMVIRRFDRHYQTFCGFDSIESAQLYLAVFEKLYRFTPFSDDARPAIRGKCPLQLAGYDISQFPFASLCQGFSPDWPLQLGQELVP